MSITNLKKASLAAGVTMAMAQTTEAGRNKGVKKLIAGIRDNSANVRTKAWQSAGEVGAPAVKLLAQVMTDSELEVARAAKRALWKIVRHTGRPGADEEKKAVEARLRGLLSDDQPVAVRREVLWMLSEIAGARSVKPMARLLNNKDLREDARMALERIPNKRAIQALSEGFKTAPEDFKPNLAQSLRKRGREVSGYPCVKLVPKK